MDAVVRKLNSAFLQFAVIGYIVNIEFGRAMFGDELLVVGIQTGGNCRARGEIFLENSRLGAALTLAV